MSLSLGDGNNQVVVADLAIIAGKQQVTLGNLERDLILQTQGNLQVQIGGKFYNIPLSPAVSTNTVGDTSAPVVILNTTANLSTSTYLGDGYLYYIKETSSFYIAIGGTYLLIAEGVKPIDATPITPIDKTYLSFVISQSLTGEQKNQVLSNTGYLVPSLASLNIYAKADVYAGQLIYSIDDKRHYYLNDVDNPSQVKSWKELYLNLESGGIVKSPVGISVDDNTTSSSSALHITGSYTQGRITSPLTTNSSVFTLGAIDYSTGVSIFNYQDNTYFQALKQGKGFQFLTFSYDNIQRTPLTISGNNIGIGGSTNINYTLSVNGTSNFTGKSLFNNGIADPTFVSGIFGTGYDLGYDINNNQWVLEVDKIIDRSKEQLNTTFLSKSINGSYWSNPAIKITTIQLIDYINVYVKASLVGNYKDVTGTKVLIPLSDKLTYAMCDAPSVETDTGSSRITRTINLAYGVGYMDSSSVDLSYTTYLRETDGVTYDVMQGNYSLVSGAFVTDTSGIFANTLTIDIAYIETESVGMCYPGDLLYQVQWDSNGMPLSMILVEVQSVNETGAYVYVYNGTLTEGVELIKIGGSGSDNNSIHFNGIDPNGDYIQSLSNISSFRDIFNNYYTQLEGFQTFPIFDFKINTDRVRASIGNLVGIVNESLGLNNSNQIGVYSDNAYLKGNFILDSATFTNVPLVTTYENFIMLHADGTLEQRDMSVDFDYWNNKADYNYITQEIPTGVINGSNSVFTTNNPISLNTEMVFLRGMLQNVGVDYNIVYNNIVFVTAPLIGDNISVNYVTNRSNKYIQEIPTGVINGSNLTFTITHNIVNNTQMLFLRGLLQQPSIDYIINGNIITFITAPIVGDNIQISYIPDVSTNYICREVPIGVINGSNTVYTLVHNVLSGTQMVFLRGLLQQPSIDYIISNNIITFTIAPLIGDTLLVTYIKN